MTAPSEDRTGAVLSPSIGPLPEEAPALAVAPSAPTLRKPTAAQAIWRRAVGYWKPLLILAASRLMTLGAIYTTRYISSTPLVGGGLSAGQRFDRLASWDGGWYLVAAQHGWPHSVPTSGGFPAYSALAFFPAFPLAIRAVAVTGAGWIVAGAVTALLCQIAMVVLLWQLVKEVWGEVVAERGMLLFLFGPGALAFALIYSEPMLLAAAAACLLALRRRWWLVAGLAAAVGSAVRPVGIALFFCCAWEAVGALRSRREWRSLSAPILAPLGLVSWMGYLWAHTGNPFIWNQAEKAWDDQFDPLTLITRFVNHETTHTGVRLQHFLPVAGAVFCLVAIVLLFKTKPKAPASLIIFSIVVVLIAASSRIVGLRPRLIETAFPLVFVFGYWLKDHFFSIVLASAGVALGGYVMLSLTTGRFIP